MKKIFTLAAIMVFGMALSAQNENSFTYRFNDYDNNDGYHNTDHDSDYRGGDRRGDNDERRGDRYDRRGNDYDRTHRYKRKRYRVRFNQLNYRDQKRIVKLERKHERTERSAWHDGYLSRREKKCLRDIQRDIDRIWARYERYRNDGYRNFRACG